MIQRYGKSCPHNFGDDINVPIIETLTGKRVLLYSTLHSRKIENLLCIGSIIETHCNSLSNIWGSGALYGDKPLKEKPKRVFAVRGKLTRDYLESNGIFCPPIFGDPALLLPYIYDRPVKQNYLYGIIPHYTEIEDLIQNPIINGNADILIIDLVHYAQWKDVIDSIRSCKYILSSSLHGLIVSDAYKIPNIHIKLSNKVNGGEFKYKDYCSGVGKEYIEPLDFREGINLDDAMSRLEKYKPIIDYDCNLLLQNAPFKISTSFTNKMKTTNAKG